MGNLDPPPPQTKVTIVGKNEIYHWQNLVPPFLVHNFLGPRGRFRTARAQRARSTNHYVVYHGNTPENHPPTERGMIHSTQHRVQNSGPWDPWQASD